MRKLVITAVVLYAACFCAMGVTSNGRTHKIQEGWPEKFIRENIVRAADNVHCYEVLDSTATPPPSGYKPFYISHIGRHGSRTPTSSTSLKYVDYLHRCDSLGNLTPEGRGLMKTLDKTRELIIDTGMDGILTDRGAAEHRAIASRVCRHYPEIFTDPSRRNVSCFSTTVPRVIRSMDNFTSVVAESYPYLAIRKRFSNESRFTRYQTSNVHVPDSIQNRIVRSPAINKAIDKRLNSYDWSRLCKLVFKDGKVPEKYRGREGSFFNHLYSIGVYRQCFLDDDPEWFRPYFTDDEMFEFWRSTGSRNWQRWGWTVENRGYPPKSTYRILQSIVRDADAVIAGADTCATFRFSHDGNVLPLICLMGLYRNTFTGSWTDIDRYVCMGYTMHMAGNVQFVFFRNKKGKVLVKILLNEEETFIPALRPKAKGVFYDWETLKAYLLERSETGRSLLG